MIPQRIPHVALASFPGREAERRAARLSALAHRLGATGHRADETLRYYSAPGRTELGGNHTDHNGGCVLAASVHLDMLAAARPRSDGIITLNSPGYTPVSIDISDIRPDPKERGSPASIIRGLAGWLARRNLPRCGGFDIAMDSEVPAGSGLSSSAAFEMLIAAIFDDMGSYDIPPVEWALGGQFAENEYFGKPCGLMDQLACALGGIAFIDFAEPAHPKIETIAFDFASRGFALAIVATDSDHEDLTDEYAAIPGEMGAVAKLFGRTSLRGLSASDLLERVPEIRARCGDRAFLRAWHFVHETGRPALMSAALARGDVRDYLELVRESGRSSWMFLQNVHAGEPRRQSLGIALAIGQDAIGETGACRVHGGGFAGTVQAYVPESAFSDFVARMEAVFGPGSVCTLEIRPFGVCRIRIDASNL